MAGELIQATTKVYGNYRGLVEDNADPLKLGRCRIRIYPLFKDMEATVLPWSVPAMGLFDGAGIAGGCMAVPKIGTYVFCFFEAGDIYQPVYFAEAQTAAHGVMSDDPNVKAWITSGGFTIHIDDTNQTIRVVHPSGSEINMDNADGTISIQSTGSKIDIVSAGDVNVNASGKVDVTATGNVTIQGALVSINP